MDFYTLKSTIPQKSPSIEISITLLFNSSSFRCYKWGKSSNISNTSWNAWFSSCVLTQLGVQIALSGDFRDLFWLKTFFSVFLDKWGTSGSLAQVKWTIFSTWKFPVLSWIQDFFHLNLGAWRSAKGTGVRKLFIERKPKKVGKNINSFSPERAG